MPGTKVSPGWQSKESTLLGTYFGPRGSTKGSRLRKALECQSVQGAGRETVQQGWPGQPLPPAPGGSAELFQLAQLVAFRGGTLAASAMG